MLEALLDGIMHFFAIIDAHELLNFADSTSEKKGSELFVFDVGSKVA